MLHHKDFQTKNIPQNSLPTKPSIESHVKKFEVYQKFVQGLTESSLFKIEHANFEQTLYHFTNFLI